MIVISDLDGTIALIEHRRPILSDDSKKMDQRWRDFFAACDKDEPNVPVILTLSALKSFGHEIVILSARSDEVKDKTLTWLEFYEVPYDRLYMRKAGDFTVDCELKKEWLKGFDLSEILCVFDDRDSVVKMWREHGLNCFQVAPGDF